MTSIFRTTPQGKQPTPQSDRRLPMWLLISFALAVLVKLSLVTGQSIFAIGNAEHDDRLFVRLAASLLSGDWLGPYNELTLAKGPFFPMWIAANAIIGLPLRLAEQLLYAAASVIAAIALRPALRRDWGILVIFLLVLFNPMSFTDQATTRVIREGIYPALTLFVVATASGLLLRVRRPIRTVLLWSSGCGLSLAAFWLTREEGIWLLPFLLPLLAWTSYRVWVGPTRNLARLAACALPFVILGAGINGVSWMNQRHYGVFLVIDLQSPEFLEAYGALSRVEHMQMMPSIPVPRETRERIYPVSPTFEELRETMENPGFWTKPAKHLGYAPDEIAGGWFIWALRDAAARVGYHESAITAAAFYRRMAEEINAACANRQLDCLPPRATLRPVLRSEYLEPMLSATHRALLSLISLNGFRASTTPSIGDENLLALFRNMTRERLAVSPEPSPDVFVRGWAVDRYRSLRVSLFSGDDWIADAEALPSPDVALHFQRQGIPAPHARRARFDLKAKCPKPCELRIFADSEVVARLPLTSNSHLVSPPVWAHIDSAGPSRVHRYVNHPAVHRLDRFKVRSLERIGRGIQAAMPYLIALTVLGYIALTGRLLSDTYVRDLWLIQSLVMAAIMARVVMLALIDATSFPAIEQHYLTPIFALLFLLIATSITYLLDEGVERFKNRIIQ